MRDKHPAPWPTLGITTVNRTEARRRAISTAVAPPPRFGDVRSTQTAHRRHLSCLLGTRFLRTTSGQRAGSSSRAAGDDRQRDGPGVYRTNILLLAYLSDFGSVSLAVQTAQMFLVLPTVAFGARWSTSLDQLRGARGAAQIGGGKRPNRSAGRPSPAHRTPPHYPYRSIPFAARTRRA